MTRYLHSLRKLILEVLPNRLEKPEGRRNRQAREYEKQLIHLMEKEPWCIDHVEIDDQAIEIRGWALAPQGDHASVSFTINGNDFDSVEYPLPREDIEKLFWYYPKARESGFICRSKLTSSDLTSPNAVELKYVDQTLRQPINPVQNYRLARKAFDQSLPMPDAERRIRVHGGDSESSFLFDGYNTYLRLAASLEATFHRNFDDFNRILDWGCGCGRLTRYFGELTEASVTGVDVDRDNVAWCQQNLRFGNFLTIPLHPPTELESASYDLLIGISIFTHLPEKEQFKWLSELRRVATRDAILLMTVHGDTTVGRSNLPYEMFRILQRKGILDIGQNPALDGVIQEENYYRNTYHTPSYITKKWSKYFDIIATIPGYIGNHQDLVIMRK